MPLENQENKKSMELIGEEHSRKIGRIVSDMEHSMLFPDSYGGNGTTTFKEHMASLQQAFYDEVERYGKEMQENNYPIELE